MSFRLVVVGASFGGMNMQFYASRYPEEVAGIVLVDSIHPDLDTRIEQLLTPSQAEERRADLAANDEGVRFADLLDSDDQVREALRLPDVPLVALRHGIGFDMPPSWPDTAIEHMWTDLQTDLVSRVPNGKLRVAEYSRHRISESQPELVVAAIQEVVKAAEGRRQ